MNFIRIAWRITLVRWLSVLPSIPPSVKSRAVARLVLLTMLAAISLDQQPARACTVQPPEINERNAQLVRSSPVIVLARVVAIDKQALPALSTMTFAPIKALKGQLPGTFTRQGYVRSDVRGPDDFDGHRRADFWAFDAGNAIQPGDCVAHGIYELGSQYLIFMRAPSHFRAQENIRTDDDLWLAAVTLLIKDQTSPK